MQDSSTGFRMIRKSLKRTPGSFPVDGPPFGRNLILVHGFRASEDGELNYQASLESWVKGWDACRGGGYLFRPFRFRSSKVLNGGMDALRRTGFSLLSKVQTIKDEFQVASENTSVDESPNRSRTSPPLKRPRFIFVAHGLGAWLVKHMLSSAGDANWIATDTIGLIFLDVSDISHHPLSSPETKEHEETIKQLQRRFSGEFPRNTAAKVPELASNLQEIDTRFNEARKKLATQLGPDEPLPTKFQAVWNDPSTEQTQPTQSTPQRRSVALILSSMLRFHRHGRKIENSSELSNEISRFITEIGKLERRNTALGLFDPPELGSHRVSSPSPSGSEFRSPSSSSDAIYRTRSSGTESGRSVGRSSGLATGRKRRSSPVHQRAWSEAETEARSFLERGKLSNAMTLFQDALEDLEREPNPAELELQRNKIETWIAVITLLNGDATGAGDKLERLLIPRSSHGVSGEEHHSSDDWGLKREMRRWLGISLVCQGKYSDGVVQLERLVRKDLTNPMTDASAYKAKRELAIAYGLQGTITKARDTIRSLQELPLLDERRGSTFSIVTNHQTFKARKENVAIAAAFIELLCGDFNAALEYIKGAFTELETHLGPRHIKTFQAASLRAYLMALRGEIPQAEAECKRLLQIMPRELGSRHPLMLEVRGTLVYVYRTQRRLLEAINLAKMACEDARKVLPEKSPLALRLKAELASCYRVEGNYSSSARLLGEVIRTLRAPGEGGAGLHTLEGLRYEAGLAHVECRSGNLEDAERRAISALKKQRELFDTRMQSGEVVAAHLGSRLEPPPSVEADNDFVERLLVEVKSELELGSQNNVRESQHTPQLSQGPYPQFETIPSQSQHPYGQHDQERQEVTIAGLVQLDDVRLSGSNKLSVLRVHPLLLYTLRVLALVRSQLDGSDAKQAYRILKLVWKWQTGNNSRGTSHPVSLMTEYDCAVALLGSGEHEKARDRFEHVFTARTEVLGPLHPDTATAKREFVITMCLVNCWRHPDRYISSAQQDDSTVTPIDLKSQFKVSVEIPSERNQDASIGMGSDDWAQVEECSIAIWTQHQSLLGKRHPETLKSLIWVFTLQLLLSKIESANQTCDSLLNILRSKAVVSERLLDAVQMEGRLAQLYMEQSQARRASDILRHIADLSDELPAFQASQQLAFRSLKRRILASVRAIQDQQKKTAEASGENSFDEVDGLGPVSLPLETPDPNLRRTRTYPGAMAQELDLATHQPKPPEPWERATFTGAAITGGPQ